MLIGGAVMKAIIMMAVFSIVYLVAMDFVNKKLNSFDFGEQEYVETINDDRYYTVTIEGAITNPGTYTVNKGDTLAYLVTLSGGLKENADAKTYNLSTVLENNTTYYIGAIQEGNLEKISINTANISLLDTLPGIGSVLAKRIVSYRNSQGNFTSLEQLKKVSGIGDSLFDQIKDLICL